MEEAVQKRNTDCVYFLASPLTCKKGIDCEFRHCEIARLNPRDCWYWLAGNCINPACGFRHPPLDGHPTEAWPQSAPLSYQSSLPANKTNVPCYFYFSGFCNKGDRCSFLHGPDGSAPPEIPRKTPSAITDALHSENKTSTGNGTGSEPTGTCANPSETAVKPGVVMSIQPKDDLLQSAPRSILRQSAFPLTSLSDDEETAAIKSDSMIPVEGFMKTRSHLCTDWSSEEQVDDHIEPEERWESSPGFDVLVDNDNISENLGNVDDPEYLLAINGDHRDLDNCLLDYNLEDGVEYDPMYPDAELLYERKIYNAYNCLDNEHIIDDVREPASQARERMLDSIFSGKRNFLPTKFGLNGHSLDLRDYLRKRRVVDGHRIIRSSRRHESCRLIVRSKERSRTHVDGQWLHRRLASGVGKDHIMSYGDNGTFPNGANQREWLRRSQSSRFRQRSMEKRLTKRQSHSSGVSRKPVSRESRSTQTCTGFTGPKTLAEIKEEKRKAEENGDSLRKMEHSKITLADFQGPKPLSEILKEKRRL